MAATPIQIAAFQDLARGGGFFNPIGGFYNPPATPGVVAPLLSSPLWVLFNTLIPQIQASNPIFTGVTPLGCTGLTLPTCAQIAAYPSVLAAQLLTYLPEFYGAYYSITARQESPKEDPLFALTKIPGITSASTAGSLMEHSDKYFGHRRSPLPGFVTGACNYYKSGLPPILIKIASAKSVNSLMGPEELDQTSYPTTQSFAIIAVTPGLNGTWTVTGDQTQLFTEGATFAVSGNAPAANIGYTVLSSTLSLGNTVITVTGTIPGAATPSGTIGAVFAKGYFAVTFPLINVAPYLNASVDLLSGNTWYQEMIGVIAGAIDTEITDMVTYYSDTLVNSPAGQAFLTTFNFEFAAILTELGTINSLATFNSVTGLTLSGYTNPPSFLTNLNNIAAAYVAAITAIPPPAAQRQRIDAQILQENLRYYGQQFVILNQGSVSTGFYQYKKNPEAYAVLTACSDPTMLAAMNEDIN